MSCAVLQKIYSLSEPVSNVEKWQFLPSNAHARRYPGDANSLLDSLRSEFSIGKLKAAKVVKTADDGELTLSPKLSTAGSVFVSLRHNKNKAPFELMTAGGCLTSDVPPSIIAYRDWTATQYIGNSLHNILVAADMCSAVVLRSLNFPAAVAAGLDTLSDPQRRQLCGQCEFEPGRQARPLPQLEKMRNKNIRFVFVLWDVVNLNSQIPDDIQVIVTRFARIAEALNLIPEELKIWRPTSNDIDDIAAAADSGDRAVSILAIRSSLKTSVVGLDDYFQDLRRPQDYGGARLDLIEEIDRVLKVKYESPELSKKLDHLHRVFEQTVVRPLINDANSTPNPVRPILLLSAADLTERWHESCRYVRAATHGVLKCDDPRSGPAISEEKEQRRLILDQLLKTYRELNRKQ
jgi:hypothetical protein